MSLRPPSTSPSPSPGPHNGNPRASLQPQPRGTAATAAANLTPIATRRDFTPNARPTSELLAVGPGAFQTPETEAIDQWFENLQNYEATLEEMAAASLDVNFKEELSAIEQWFRVLSEAERTAALYSLLQHSTQVQIRFFITVLQQMARSDPMTALLSPAMGSSMQSQMEAKLASMGLKSPALPPSPSIRGSFGAGVGTPPMSASASRQSLSVDPATYLSPDSAGKSGEAAAQLAQQRAKFKASNTSHRLSAPIAESGRPQSLWTQSNLAQVAERAPSPATSDLAPPSASARPKSMDFTGLANQFARSPRQQSADSIDDVGSNELDLGVKELRLNDQLSPMVGGNWASMVNTPMIPMFPEGGPLGAQANALDAAAAKLANWNMSNASKGIVLDDVKKFKRETRSSSGGPTSSTVTTSGGTSLGMNGASKANGRDDASLAPPSSKWKATTTSTASGPSWRAGSRSPSNVGSARFGGSDAGSTAASSFTGGPPISPAMGLGMGMGNFGVGGMYNGMGMGGLGDMNLQQQTALQNQMIAAQLGGFSPQLGGGFPANPMGMGMGNFGIGMGMGMGVQGQPGGPNRPVRGAVRAGAPGSTNARGGAVAKGPRPAAKPKQQLKEEDISVNFLNDIAGWFHALRLHKYTPVVQNKTWQELVIMDDAQLEKIGISALGARRKLLKHFVVVRNKMGIPHPEGAETGAEGSEDEEE